MRQSDHSQDAQDSADDKLKEPAASSQSVKLARLGAQLFGLGLFFFVICRVVFFILYPGIWSPSAIAEKSFAARVTLSVCFLIGVLGAALFLLGKGLEWGHRFRKT